MVVDGQTAYWNGYKGFTGNNSTTYWAPLDGGPASLFSTAIGVNLVLDHDYLYGEQLSGNGLPFQAIPLTASPSHPAPPSGLQIGGTFAVDSSSIYWIGNDPSTGVGLHATNFADGGTRMLDPAPLGGYRYDACCVAINSTDVFWFIDSGYFSDGQLLKTPK